LSWGTNIREHLLNLINALTNLSPSRNIISQLILLLPEDPAVIERSYPEIVSPNTKDILESLGVKFGDKVERIEKSFSESLYKHIHKTFDWLDDEHLYIGIRTNYIEYLEKMDDVRSSLAKLTGVHINSIPNPYFEWAKLVLKKLSNKYGQSKISSFLRALLAHDSFRDRNYNRGSILQRFLDEIRTRIGVNPAEFKEILNYIVSMGESEYLYRKGSRRYPQGHIYLEHAKYHLDPLLCETYRYEYYKGWGYVYEYRVRHKETLEKVLREISTRGVADGRERGKEDS